MVGFSQARVAPIARLLFWAALLFALVMALSPRPPITVEVMDKWQHMAAFGALTVLACAAWPYAPLFRIAERLSFLGAMIELVQSIPALHRDCDIMDWVADTAIIVGVVLVVAAARTGRPRRL
jgi:hypothetical protein